MPTETRAPFTVTEPRLLLADVVHESEGPFSVVLVGDDGDRELLASTNGPVEWRVATGVDPGTYRYEVTHGGQYAVEPVAVTPDDVTEPPLEREDEGHGVVGPISLPGRVAVALEIATDGRAVVSLRDARGRPVGVLLNEPGPCRGERVVETEGVGFVTVRAEGPWLVAVRETDAHPPSG